ncbi:BET1-like protein [Halocaridina rubra]|uniref:BET1-like protein n=1 Tax=Halocaridina rubra TaxID=373956 RepID=A0AAN8X4B5_HALRR
MANWGGAEEHELDNRNQQRTFALAGKVSTLRSLALDIENEAYEHNRLLDGVGNDFTSSDTLMGGSINRVKTLLTSGRQNRKVLCYTALFVVLLIFMVWFFSSRIFSGE